jgi:hypothetical protein
MTQPKAANNPYVQALRKVAMGYPETQVGTSCTKDAYKARSKTFFFLGADDSSFTAMLKLRDSLPEAHGLAAKDPAHYKAGATGWITVTFRHEESPPRGLLERWIYESYRTVAPRPLVAVLTARDPSEAISKKPSRKKA